MLIQLNDWYLRNTVDKITMKGWNDENKQLLSPDISEIHSVSLVDLLLKMTIKLYTAFVK